MLKRLGTLGVCSLMRFRTSQVLSTLRGFFAALIGLHGGIEFPGRLPELKSFVFLIDVCGSVLGFVIDLVFHMKLLEFIALRI